MISADNDGFVMLWDVGSGRRLRAFKSDEGIQAVAISPDVRRLATGGYDQMVRIRDLASGKEVHALAGHAGTIRGLAFSPDGKRLASASSDRTVRIWDPIFGQEVLVLRGHSGPIEGLAFSPDGDRIASASVDRTVRIWEAERQAAPAAGAAFDEPGK